MRSFPSSISPGGTKAMPANDTDKNAFGQQKLSLNIQSLNALLNSGKAIWNQERSIADGTAWRNATASNEQAKWNETFLKISGTSSDPSIMEHRYKEDMLYPLDNKNPNNHVGTKLFDLGSISYCSGLIQNEFQFPGDIALTMLNKYRFQYSNYINIIGDRYGVEEDENGKKNQVITDIYQVSGIPSLWNPNSVVIKSKNLIFKDKPVLADEQDVDGKIKKLKPNDAPYDFDTNDCSIKNLCTLSARKIKDNEGNTEGSGMGKALYRYADFMYCRDVGKISNNHLITLRRFSSPISDNLHIGHENQMLEKARLVTWFGNGDNKLDDILKFSFKETYKEYKSEVQEKQSEEDNASARGPVGKFLNSINPRYNAAMAAGRTGNHNYISQIGGKVLGANFGQGGQYEHLSSTYDKNRIYSKIPSTQDGHIYEGKLVFNHEFQVVFSYKLRAYDSINPRAAFIDLIHNILTVCYSKGAYWAGERRVVGAPANVDGWRKYNAFIDNAFDKLEGIGGALASGSMDFSSLLSTMSNAIGNMVGAAKDKVNQMVNSATENVDKNADTATKVVQTGAKAAQDLNKRTGFLNGIKGMIKNGLGRPAVYQFDSMIGPGPVGFWHIVVGNPLNPIVSMGNLLLDNADLQLLGPLGLDDFPTEIKLTCKFKHGRSRDMVEFEKILGDGIESPMTNITLADMEKYYEKKNVINIEQKSKFSNVMQIFNIPGETNTSESLKRSGMEEENGHDKLLAMQANQTGINR